MAPMKFRSALCRSTFVWDKSTVRMIGGPEDCLLDPTRSLRPDLRSRCSCGAASSFAIEQGYGLLGLLHLVFLTSARCGTPEFHASHASKPMLATSGVSWDACS